MEALLLPVLLVAVFYFLLIRPQQKQRREMLSMQQAMGPGSRVMTGAGLIATVVSIDEAADQVVLEVAPGITNTYIRRAIVRTLDEPTEAVDGAASTPVSAADQQSETAEQTIERLEREANSGRGEDDRPA